MCIIAAYAGTVIGLHLLFGARSIWRKIKAQRKHSPTVSRLVRVIEEEVEAGRQAVIVSVRHDSTVSPAIIKDIESLKGEGR
jgi:hypothetical protein